MLFLHFRFHIFWRKQSIFTISWRQECYILAFDGVLSQRFSCVLFTEAAVEIHGELTQAAGFKLFATFIVLQRDFTDRPGSSTGNCTGNKIATKWYSFCSLLCKVAQAQTTGHGYDQFACMLHSISGVQRFTIEGSQAQDEANLCAQEDRNINQWNR